MATDYDKYPHYFKRIPEGMTHLDVYGVLRLFDVQSQELGHAIKKLLVPGIRGSKSSTQDIQEAIDTLERWKQLNVEFMPKTASEHAESYAEEDRPKPKQPTSITVDSSTHKTADPISHSNPHTEWEYFQDKNKTKLPTYTNLCSEVPKNLTPVYCTKESKKTDTTIGCGGKCSSCSRGEYAIRGDSCYD